MTYVFWFWLIVAILISVVGGAAGESEDSVAVALVWPFMMFYFLGTMLKDRVEDKQRR